MEDNPVTLQVSYFVAGFKDATRFGHVFRQISDDARIRTTVLRASFIQLVLLCSVLALDFIIAPQLAKRGLEEGMTGKVSWYFELFWLYPLLGLSFYFSGNISAAKTGDGLATSTNPRPSLVSRPSGGTNSRLFDGIARALVISTCFVTSFVLYRIWFIGRFLCFIFLCIVDGYYCFENLWATRGWDLKESAKFLEERWPYFAGFGLPCTFISFFHSSPIVNLALFSLTYPINLLLAISARPLPAAPENTSDLLASGAGTTTSTQTPLASSHAFAKRLPVLWIAVQLNDLISHPSIRRLLATSTYSSGPKKSSTFPASNYAPHTGASGFGASYRPATQSSFLRPSTATPASGFPPRRPSSGQSDTPVGSAASVATRSASAYGASAAVSRRGNRAE